MVPSVLRIGALATQCGVSIDTIRYYERCKLLPRAGRSRGGFRLFAPDAVERIRFIKQAQEDPIPICYCFGHTVASAREEIARTGHSTVVARITAEIPAGHCACEVKNPAGSCCLGDVSRVVKTLLKEHVLCTAPRTT